MRVLGSECVMRSIKAYQVELCNYILIMSYPLFGWGCIPIVSQIYETASRCESYCVILIHRKRRAYLKVGAMNERNIKLTPDGARKLSDALMRRRIELGIRSARMLGEQTGLDYRTITAIEGRRRDTITRNTLAVMEMKLNWPSGYLLKLLESADIPNQSVEIKVPGDASPESVAKARQVAQAAFNATLKELENNI